MHARILTTGSQGSNYKNQVPIICSVRTCTLAKVSLDPSRNIDTADPGIQ